MTAPVTGPDTMYARQQVAVLHAVQEAQAAWARLDPYDLDGSWENDVRPRAVIAVEEAQIEAAAPAGLYVAAAVLAAGAVSTPVARVVAGAFAGFASNGLPLAALLDYVLAYLRRALAVMSRDVVPVKGDECRPVAKTGEGLWL